MLADRLGGMGASAQVIQSLWSISCSPEVKTFSEDNKTTTDYYIHVLEYLWNHQEKYADLLELIGESFPGEYYKKFLPDLVIQQKPGYVAEALNVDAIVHDRPLIWLPSILQDWVERLQKVLKSVALVFIN